MMLHARTRPTRVGQKVTMYVLKGIRYGIPPLNNLTSLPTTWLLTCTTLGVNYISLRRIPKVLKLPMYFTGSLNMKV